MVRGPVDRSPGASSQSGRLSGSKSGNSQKVSGAFSSDPSGFSRSESSYNSTIMDDFSSCNKHEELDAFYQHCLVANGHFSDSGNLTSTKVLVVRELEYKLRHLDAMKNVTKRTKARKVDLIIPKFFSEQNVGRFSLTLVIEFLQILSKLPQSMTEKDTKFCKDIVLFALTKIASMPPITDKDIKDTGIFGKFKTAQQELKQMILDYLKIHYSDKLPITITNPMTSQPEIIDIETVKKDCAEQGHVKPFPLSQQLRSSALEKERPFPQTRLNGSSGRTDEKLHRLNNPRTINKGPFIHTQCLQYRAEQNDVALAPARRSRSLTLPSLSPPFMASPQQRAQKPLDKTLSPD